MAHQFELSLADSVILIDPDTGEELLHYEVEDLVEIDKLLKHDVGCKKAHMWNIGECLHCKIQELQVQIEAMHRYQDNQDAIDGDL